MSSNNTVLSDNTLNYIDIEMNPIGFNQNNQNNQNSQHTQSDKDDQNEDFCLIKSQSSNLIEQTQINNLNSIDDNESDKSVKYDHTIINKYLKYFYETYDCNKLPFIKETINYYTHFLMFIIFEVLFYFNYIVKYEKKLIYKMISGLTDDLMDFTNVNVPMANKCNFYEKVCKTFVDDKTNKANTEIYDNALYLIYGMSAFLFFLVIIELNIYKQKSTFPVSFKKSLLLMIFVGIFDYLFFNYFILEYKIIDTGELMCYLYEHDNVQCNDNEFNNSTKHQQN